MDDKHVIRWVAAGHQHALLDFELFSVQDAAPIFDLAQKLLRVPLPNPDGPLLTLKTTQDISVPANQAVSLFLVRRFIPSAHYRTVLVILHPLLRFVPASEIESTAWETRHVVGFVKVRSNRQITIAADTVLMYAVFVADQDYVLQETTALP